MSTKWNDVGRICSVCKTFKPWSDYSLKHPKNRNIEKLHQRRQPKCKDCAKKETRKYLNSKSKEELKDRRLICNYGLTLVEYNSMLLTQKCKCLICSRNLDLFGKFGPNSPVVDHCHRHGHVRGILCNECNRGLGYFHDNPEALLKAASYLTGK